MEESDNEADEAEEREEELAVRALIKQSTIIEPNHEDQCAKDSLNEKITSQIFVSSPATTQRVEALDFRDDDDLVSALIP